MSVEQYGDSQICCACIGILSKEEVCGQNFIHADTFVLMIMLLLSFGC